MKTKLASIVDGEPSRCKKPKKTRSRSKKARARAKKAAKAEKAAAMNDSEGDANKLVYTIGAVLLAMAVGTVPYLYFKGNGLENLSLSDPARIKAITASGDPWLIVCYTGSENVPEFITKAAPKLKRGGIETGIIDCSAKFTDKKTLFKKLALQGGGNKNLLGEKRLILVANGKKAVEMPGDVQKTVDGLLDWALPKAHVPPPYTPFNSKEFERVCIKRNMCVAVTNAGPLGEEKTSIVQSIAEKYRTLTFVTIDTVKTNFTLRDVDLPEGGGPNVLVFHKPSVDDRLDKGIKTSISVMAGAFNAEAIAAHIDTQKAGGYAAFTPLKRSPQLALIVEKKPETEEEPAVPKMSITEKRAAQREREQKKRAEMDAELDDMFQTIEEGDEDLLQGDTGDDDEEVEVDMDEEEEEEEEEDGSNESEDNHKLEMDGLEA